MGRDRRRQPQRIPLTRDIGNKARIRKIIDDQHYMLDIGSRVGSPVIAFYIGSLVLREGELVLATWREESGLWEIVGPVREAGQSGTGFVATGFEEIAGGSSQFVLVHEIADDFTFVTVAADPATQPTAFADKILFSPNDQYIAVLWDDQLGVWAWDGAWGVQLDVVTLPDDNVVGARLGLAWSADGSAIAVAHSFGATGDALTVYPWSGSALGTPDSVAIGGSGLMSGIAVDWHPTLSTRLMLAAANGWVRAFSWDGATLTEDASTNVGSADFIDDIKWRPDGEFVVVVSHTGGAGLRVFPWDEGSVAFGVAILPGTAPANLISEGVAWSGDGTLIAVANGINTSGYTFDGAVFGSRIDFTLPGASPDSNDVGGHPIESVFVFAYETASADEQYVATARFDGVTWTVIDSVTPGPGIHFDGISAAFNNRGAATPTEQLDASEITYTPDDDTDWPTVPDDVAEALDELADRLTGLSRIVDLPLNSFVIHTGTPAYAQVGTNMHAWAFDDTIDELVVYSFTVPPKYASRGSFRLRYVMASATTNSVVVSADALPATEGDDFDAAGTAATTTDAVQAGASDDLGVVDVTPVVTYAAGERVRIIVGRLGADGSDNAAGDMWLVGVEFRYTAAL